MKSRSLAWLPVMLCCLLLWFPNAVNTSPDTPTGHIARLETLLYGLAFWSVWFAAWPRLWQALLAATAVCFPWLPIDIYFRLKMGVPLGHTFVGVAMETHAAELYDFFTTYGLQLGLACTFLFFIAIWGVLIAWRHKLAWSHRSRIWVLLLMPAFGALMQFAFAQQEASVDVAPPPDVFRVEPLGYWADKWSSVYPLNLPMALRRYIKDNDRVAQLRSSLQNFKFDAVKSAPGVKILVLVIGESSRADRWRLGGYVRDTNPLLSQVPNAFFIQNLVTRSIATRTAVPGLVSRQPILLPDGSANRSVEPSFLKALSEIGYKTFWLSNQSATGHFDTSTLFYARDAQYVRFLNPANFDVEGQYDEVLLGPLIGAIESRPAGSPIAIVLHTMGSHFNYGHRYPDAFDRFRPSLKTPGHGFQLGVVKKEETNNAYDNSILYTDYFLAKVIDALKATNVPAAMLYVSDHGEDLYESGCLSTGLIRLGAPSYRVPAVLWLSDQAIKLRSDWVANLKENLSYPWVSDVAYGTLLDLAGVSIRGGRELRSLVRPRPKYLMNRLVLGADGDMVDFDKAVLRDRCRISSAQSR